MNADRRETNDTEKHRFNTLDLGLGLISVPPLRLIIREKNPKIFQ